MSFFIRAARAVWRWLVPTCARAFSFSFQERATFNRSLKDKARGRPGLRLAGSPSAIKRTSVDR